MTTALIGYGRLSVGLVEKHVRDLEELVDRCYCPRCGNGPKGEWDSASLVTADRCLGICNPCANQEAIAEMCTGIVPPIATWPTLQPRRRR